MSDSAERRELQAKVVSAIEQLQQHMGGFSEVDIPTADGFIAIQVESKDYAELKDSNVVEMIPDMSEWPDWAAEGFRDGNFFRRAIDEVARYERNGLIHGSYGRLTGTTFPSEADNE